MTPSNTKKQALDPVQEKVGRVYFSCLSSFQKGKESKE